MTFPQCGDGREYPWGNNWPPVSGRAGNYRDEASKPIFAPDYDYMKGYYDGFPVTAPVDKLWVNPWGLAGVGGNVMEMCVSNRNPESFGAWRGASWFNLLPDILRCSHFYGSHGRWRNGYSGFRLVLSG